MVDKMLDIKLIEEFDGTGSVTEWIAKVEIVCKIRNIEDLSVVLPLRLTKGAFAVYQQLSELEKTSASDIKKALIAAFAVDQFVAYEDFTARKLQPGESVDVFLADLKHLSSLFGGVPSRVITCAFVNGLPSHAKQAIRAGVRLDNLTLSAALARARAVLVGTEAEGVVAFAKAEGKSQPGSRSRNSGRKWACQLCNSPSHSAKFCDAKRETKDHQSPRWRRTSRRCFRCNSSEHLMSQCSGNSEEEKPSVQALSSDQE